MNLLALINQLSLFCVKDSNNFEQLSTVTNKFSWQPLFYDQVTDIHAHRHCTNKTTCLGQSSLCLACLFCFFYCIFLFVPDHLISPFHSGLISQFSANYTITTNCSSVQIFVFKYRSKNVHKMPFGLITYFRHPVIISYMHVFGRLPSYQDGIFIHIR